MEDALKLDKKSASEHIVGSGVSCFWHSMLGLDSTGKTITPIYIWADSRCRFAALELARRFSWLVPRKRFCHRH